MEGPRAPKSNEVSEIVEFLNENLRPESQWSITEEYPTAFEGGNLKNVRIIKDRDQVLSHAVVRPILIKTPIGFYKVAAIGSVVTAGEHRQKGLSQKVLEDCVQHAKDMGNDFAILWTNLYDFYRKFGFELAGTEFSILINKDIPDQTLNYKYMNSKNIDPAAIYKVFSKHTVATIRTIEEIRKYLNIPNSNVYTAWNTDGSLAAYAVEGKGADLKDFVHEWGGGVTPLLHLFNYIRKTKGKPFSVIAPAHSINLVQRMINAGFYCHTGFLGMMKVLNSKFLFPKITRHAQVDLGVKDFKLEENNGVYTIGIGSDVIQTEDEKRITQLLLGPSDFRDESQLSVETQETLRKIFPLKMWIWGWDSV